MSNSAAPPIPSTIAATPILLQPITREPAATTPIAEASKPTPPPEEMRECLITVDLTCFWPNVFLSGYREQDGILHSTGCLWDKSVLDDPWGAVPVGQRFIEDPDHDDGERVVKILLGLAMDKGYTHCEVRNYGMGNTDSYLDADAFDVWYSGPIPPPDSSGL